MFCCLPYHKAHLIVNFKLHVYIVNCLKTELWNNCQKFFIKPSDKLLKKNLNEILIGNIGVLICFTFATSGGFFGFLVFFAIHWLKLYCAILFRFDYVEFSENPCFKYDETEMILGAVFL